MRDYGQSLMANWNKASKGLVAEITKTNWGAQAMYENKSKSNSEKKMNERKTESMEIKRRDETKKQSKAKEQEKKKQLTRSRNCFDRVNICEMYV